MICSDRSRFIEHQRCPRGRWLGYEFGGVGLTPVRLSVPLITGLQVHEGLACLLQRAEDVEGAVRVAVAGYGRAVAGRGLEVDGGDDGYVAREQRALIEGLIRAYHVRRLPQLLEHYRVLEIEHEDLLPLGLVRIGGRKSRLALMARADALLQERESGDLYVQSFKTAAVFDRRREAEAGHDVQGLSEVMAVEERLNGWAAALGRRRGALVPEWFRGTCRSNGGQAPRIMGVRMEYPLKGERREDRANPGRWITYSPLIRGWRRPDIRPGGSGYEYAWRYEWPETNAATGEIRTRRLGRDWESFTVWDAEEIGGVKGWVETLAAGTVQPGAGDCLEAQFVTPVPYFRQQAEMEDWFEQASAQEGRVAIAAAAVRASQSPAERRSLLNRHFPQFRRSCDWPAACPFQEVCFGSDVIAQDPVASGLYTWREPHHEAEYEVIQLLRAA